MADRNVCRGGGWRWGFGMEAGMAEGSAMPSPIRSAQHGEARRRFQLPRELGSKQVAAKRKRKQISIARGGRVRLQRKPA